MRRVVEHGQLNATARSGQEPIIGTCVKDTARLCRSWRKVTVVDHVTQCLAGSRNTFLKIGDDPTTGGAASSENFCSADHDPNMNTGSCMCGPDYCADTDMLCHRGTYQVINDVFTITAKANPQEKLYMSPDGKVLLGYPPDPRAAQWHISVTGKGVKILWTELYTKTILQEYERCVTTADVYGLEHSMCARVVGHVPDPKADEMGWYIELFGDKGVQRIGMQPEVHVQFRSATSYNMMYISPLTKEALACEARGRNCPGDAGAFKFDPPLVGRMDIILDYAPGTLPPGLAAYATTVITAAILVFCICCVYASSRESKSFITGCLFIPCEEIARAVGITSRFAQKI